MTRLEIVVALLCSPNKFGDGSIRDTFKYAEKILSAEDEYKSFGKQYEPKSKFVPVEPNKKDDIPF
jgi:hypothetical protein